MEYTSSFSSPGFNFHMKNWPEQYEVWLQVKTVFSLKRINAFPERWLLQLIDLLALYIVHYCLCTRGTGKLLRTELNSATATWQLRRAGFWFFNKMCNVWEGKDLPWIGTNHLDLASWMFFWWFFFFFFNPMILLRAPGAGHFLLIRLFLPRNVYVRANAKYYGKKRDRKFPFLIFL